MPPKKELPVVPCLTLRAFGVKEQKDCIKQLNDPKKIELIADAVFYYARSSVEISDEEVKILSNIMRITVQLLIKIF